ncbi:MAG: pentapeptide repeat-containing protein [Methanocorpusculum sp.]|nr:pentapeptide repeat-containing protein [Methanocorpusculum sp.]
MDEKPEGWNQELYEKLSFEYLIECGENERIDEWNVLYLEYLESEWKRVYPERKWDPDNVFELVVSYFDFKRPIFFAKDFQEAISCGVSFAEAHLKGADFRFAHLKGAKLLKACIEGTDFNGAHLEEADFRLAHLEGADFSFARLEGADFSFAHLEGAKFRKAHIEGTDFNGAHLEEADFTYAFVDGGTMFSGNSIDGKTDFTGTALSATRIDPNLRTKLERNIREIQWKKWYDEPKFSPFRSLKKIFGKNHAEKKQEYNPSLLDRLLINPFVRLFWCLTDYGSSTKRVIEVFIVWNVFWAFIYQFILPLLPGPMLAGTNTTILNTSNIITAVMQTNLMMFSITDLATNNLDYPALTCVTVHIVIGYFILAALITRLGIMFQNLSP